MKLTKEKVNQMVKKIFIDLTDEESEIVLKQYEEFKVSLEEMHKIDTIGIDPMDYPIGTSTHELRDDLKVEVCENDEVFSNCNNLSKKYVVIK